MSTSSSRRQTAASCLPFFSHRQSDCDHSAFLLLRFDIDRHSLTEPFEWNIAWMDEIRMKPGIG
jgi:hypothetical protein